MNPAIAQSSTGAADSTHAVGEQHAPAAEAALVTFPPTRMSVDARGLALGILGVLASVVALWWAQAFIAPLLLGIVIAYTLNPLVAWFEAIKVPRVAGIVIVMAVLVAGASLAIASVVGTFVTTWMTGRIARMISVAVFISLLFWFWGWLWGVLGMLLSIPIIVIVKVVSQHVEQLHPMAELLGD